MLKKIGESFRRFGTVVGRSCYDMEFYRQVRQEPWSKGLAYFFKLMALITLVTAIFLGPAIYGGMIALNKYVESKVPDGSSLTLADGQLSAALPQPFVLNDDDEGKIVIDTSVAGLDFPRERLDKDGVLVGQEAIFMRQGDYEERTYSLKEFPSFSVNKRQALSWFDQYATVVAIAATLFLAMVYFLGISFSNLLFVLVATFISLLLAKLWRIRFSYKEWLSVSWYAVTLPVALGMVFDALGWTRIPVFPVVFFMIIAAVVADERARRQAIMPPLSPQPPAAEGPDANKPPPVHGPPERLPPSGSEEEGREDSAPEDPEASAGQKPSK